MTNQKYPPEKTHAQIEWDNEGQPISSHFGDVYFSKDNGLEETRYVFLQQNHLAERWKNLRDDSDFVIGETGFGSGLNFLAAWDLWNKTAPKNACLHFVTVEKFPLNARDLTRALNLWPELKTLADQLIENYPVYFDQGFFRLVFDNNRIQLTLIIDEASEGFSQLLTSTHPYFAAQGIKINAWFLDGFAPSKNPQMWSTALFERIAQLSTLGTTAATFSAAALVKNALKDADFSIEKVKGFGKKRDMLRAIFVPDSHALNPNDYCYPSSFSPYPVPWSVDLPFKKQRTKKAFIIGGGLAGCHSARALAERGWQVTLIERNADIAQAGSGNPQGAVYAKLSPLAEAQATFNLSCLLFALNFYRPLWQTLGKSFGEACGLLQLAYDEPEKKLHALLKQKFSAADNFVQFIDATTASQIAGTTIEHSGIFFPELGWIDPRVLCRYLVDHPNIQLITNQTIDSLSFDQGQWSALENNKIIHQADVAIICNAADALSFEQANHLPLKKIRGQLTYFPQTHHIPRLKTLVSADGYLSPPINQQYCAGATFNLRDDSARLREEDHLTNLKNLAAMLPEFAPKISTLDCAELEGRVGFRASLPDYLPAVGPAPHLKKMVEIFAPLRKNARAGVVSAGAYLPNLYLNLGHGSRGLAYTPLCAQLLAAHICGEPSPISNEWVAGLHPARFLIRDLTRNKR